MRFIIPAAMGMESGNTGNTVQALYALEINEAVHLTLNWLAYYERNLIAPENWIELSCQTSRVE